MGWSWRAVRRQELAAKLATQGTGSGGAWNSWLRRPAGGRTAFQAKHSTKVRREDVI